MVAVLEEIAARAYGHFVARGGQHGGDQGDWFRAEAELAALFTPARKTSKGKD